MPRLLPADRASLRSVAGRGTRFRLFPQLGQGYDVPETVALAAPPGSIGAGPQDERMYVADAIGKVVPYTPPEYLPPWRGPVEPPALPDPAGHFDCIPLGTPQFLAAHLYGASRRALDIWEAYLGRRVIWSHAPVFPRLELVPVVIFPNAHAGFGFLETGLKPDRGGAPGAEFLCLNFDIVAHEIGHAMLFAEVGAPMRPSGEFLAFHECFSDMVGAISALHFRSVTARLLAQTGGNLYALNLVSRLGELADLDQVRILDNTETMADVAGLRPLPEGGWEDPLGRERNEHHLAAPLTGAIWDTLVELFQDRLVARGAIAPREDPRGWDPADVAAALAPLQQASAAARARFGAAFDAALAEARDLVGQAMARTMLALDADDVSFAAVAAEIVEALVGLGQGHMLPALVDNFTWRGIDPRPLLARRAAARRAAAALPWHAVSPLERAARMARLQAARRGAAGGCRCNDPAAFIAARRLLPHKLRAEAV